MKKISTLAILLLCSAICSAQSLNVKKYGAEPLRFSSVEEWEGVHRPIIMNFFEREVYGLMPQKQVPMSFDVISETKGALGGIGLSRVDSLVSQYGGYVTRASEDGGYTTEVILPL